MIRKIDYFFNFGVLYGSIMSQLYIYDIFLFFFVGVPCTFITYIILDKLIKND